MYILSILWQKDNSWTHFYLRMNKRPSIANSLCEFLSPTFIWKWDICVGFWLHFICFLSPEIECEPGHLLHVALLVVLRNLLHGNLAEADLTFSVWNVTNPNIKKMLIIIEVCRNHWDMLVVGIKIEWISINYLPSMEQTQVAGKFKLWISKQNQQQSIFFGSGV